MSENRSNRVTRRSDEIRRRRERDSHTARVNPTAESRSRTRKANSEGRHVSGLASGLLNLPGMARSPRTSRSGSAQYDSMVGRLGLQGKARTRKERVTTAAAPPPVMTRAGMPPMTLRESSHGRKARRRYDVAMGLEGAEMRLPSLPRIAVGYRLLSFVMVAALGYLLYWLWTTPKYQVSTIQVTGLERLGQADVQAVLDITGKPVFTLAPGQLEEKLQSAFPEFSAASIQVDLPAAVTITVTERTPVLAWLQNGRTELVDAEGIAFPLRQNAQVGEIPVVEASGDPPGAAKIQSASISPEAAAKDSVLSLLSLEMEETDASADEGPVTGARQFMSSEMVTAVLALAEQAPEGTPILYDPQRGLGWKDRRGWQAYFGEMDNIAIKVRVYKAIVKKLKAEDVIPVLISVEHLHAPYYRLEP